MPAKISTTSELLKIKDLDEGEYVLTEYEIKTNNYGPCYILTCEDENNNVFKCWSNLYMYRYLSERKPKRKVVFFKKEGKIRIPGYESKVTLF